MNKKLPIDIPESLKNAADGEGLALFIGAGVSMLGKCPSWNDLADNALKKCTKNLAEFELLKNLAPRIKLSIACSLAKEKNQIIPFEELLHSHDKELKNQDANDIYKALCGLSNFIVTTNYDRWFEKYNEQRNIPNNDKLRKAHNEQPDMSHSSKQLDIPKKERYYKKEGLENIEISKPFIVHLHGALDDPQSMVLTTGNYIERYASSTDKDGNELNQTLVFLRELFKQKNVLFIGYSLEELEILEYVIQKTKNGNKEHFILQGFFSFQDSVSKSMERYYKNECRITLIPFCRDDNDWLQLKHVIEYLVEEIPALSPTVIRAKQEMEALLDD
jgi:hypothetical protein